MRERIDFSNRINAIKAVRDRVDQIPDPIRRAGMQAFAGSYLPVLVNRDKFSPKERDSRRRDAIMTKSVAVDQALSIRKRAEDLPFSYWDYSPYEEDTLLLGMDDQELREKIMEVVGGIGPYGRDGEGPEDYFIHSVRRTKDDELQARTASFVDDVFQEMLDHPHPEQHTNQYGVLLVLSEYLHTPQREALFTRVINDPQISNLVPANLSLYRPVTAGEWAKICLQPSPGRLRK